MQKCGVMEHVEQPKDQQPAYYLLFSSLYEAPKFYFLLGEWSGICYVKNISWRESRFLMNTKSGKEILFLNNLLSVSALERIVAVPPLSNF